MTEANTTGPGGAVKVAGNSALSRDQILNASDLETTFVDSKEWGGRVYIRELTATDRSRFDEAFYTARQSIEQEAGGRSARGKRRHRPAAKVTTSVEIHAARIKTLLVYLSVCDESGKRLFDDDRDLEKLGTKSSKAINEIYEASARFNGIAEEDDETEDAAGE